VPVMPLPAWARPHDQATARGGPPRRQPSRAPVSHPAPLLLVRVAVHANGSEGVRVRLTFHAVVTAQKWPRPGGRRFASWSTGWKWCRVCRFFCVGDRMLFVEVDRIHKAEA
jgi:hypothetical protein